MTITGPKVRDFSETRRRLTVDIIDAPAFEILAQLFVFISGRDEAEEYGVGPEWFEQVAEQAGPELVERLDKLGCCGQVWVGLVADAYETPDPRSVDAFVKHLEATDPIGLRTRLLELLHIGRRGSEELVARAAAGDIGAFDELMAERSENDDPGFRELMAMSPEQTRDTLLETLIEFDRKVFQGGGDELAEVLRRDAEEKRGMARTMPPERLVEAATNGITFAVEPGVEGVVLVPSIAARPWVLLTSRGPKRFFIYGVSEEALSADPTAPPPWLVSFYKALADERRLRILNILAEGPASFGELTEQLGVAKSTVHHHLRTLRGAGLIRIVVGEDKEYQLRTDAVPEAGRLLQAYLSTETKGTN